MRRCWRRLLQLHQRHPRHRGRSLHRHCRRRPRAPAAGAAEAPPQALPQDQPQDLARPETGESSPLADIGPPATLPTSAEVALQERALQSLKATHAFLKTTPWLSARGRSPAMQAACGAVEDALLLLRRLYNSLGHGVDAYLSRAEALKACDELVKAQRRQSKAAGGGPAAAAPAEAEPGAAAADVQAVPAAAPAGGSPEPEGRSPRKRSHGESELPAPAGAIAGARTSPRKRPKDAATAGPAAHLAGGGGADAEADAVIAAPSDTEPAREEGPPGEAMAVDAVLSAAVEQVAQMDERHGGSAGDGTAGPPLASEPVGAHEEAAPETMAVDDAILPATEAVDPWEEHCEDVAVEAAAGEAAAAEASGAGAPGLSGGTMAPPDPALPASDADAGAAPSTSGETA